MAGLFSTAEARSLQKLHSVLPYRMGFFVHLQLEATKTTGADDPATDAEA